MAEQVWYQIFFRGVVAKQLSVLPHPDAKDENGMGAIHWAARLGHRDCLSALLEGNVRVNEPGQNHASALHEASARGHIHCVEQLLAAGVELDSVDEQSRTCV